MVKKKYLVGDEFTIADVCLFELLDTHRLLDVTILDTFPTLQEYHNRIQNRPNLKEYFISGRHAQVNGNGLGQ